MINENLFPQDQVFSYLKQKKVEQLRSKVKANVVVIGGGMAGLSAAQSFAQKGLSVVLLEKSYCGSGASGKSSGFITPDSELDLDFFTEKFGPVEAKKIWNFVLGGVEFIRTNIKKYDIQCDYKIEDSFIVANSERSFSEIKNEFNSRKQLNYEGYLYYKDNISKVLGSSKYFGAVRYPQTYGINAYLYCQAMKEILQNSDIQIFQESPVIKIHPNGVSTIYGFVEADYIIVCVDRFLPNVCKKLNDYVYQAQTFILLSSPLNDDDVKKIFPEKNLMVWDTDFIYQYYRIFENNRFLIGGSDLISIFWGKEKHNNYKMFKKLKSYTEDKFPDIKMNFEYFWPGLIGVSKDIMPIADNDPTHKNIYYISAAAGLPWAAALGNYAAHRVIDNDNHMDKYFSLDRKFPISGLKQKILGKRISFALSNLVTLKKG